jgi:hypothetical protein
MPCYAMTLWKEGLTEHGAGYCGLGRAVRALGLSTSDPIDMDIVVRGVLRNNLSV